MTRRRTTTALFVAGVAFFAPPLLSVFSRAGAVAGQPFLPFYLMAAWAALIVGAALLAPGTDD
jgi:hypothetical protein